MNIGIVGAGTAGAISILGMINEKLYFPDKYPNLKITCIYDPAIPITQVGESTSPTLLVLLRDVLGIDFLEDVDNYDGTPRYYTKYFHSEAGGEDFYVHHAGCGLHVNSGKFSMYILKKLAERYPEFTIIEDTVDRITQTIDHATVECKNSNFDFDFVIDCRGSPTEEELNSDAYNTNVFESVNSVILFPHFQKYDEMFTSVHFHKNGWMFGVPLQHRKAFGYLYNNKHTSYEQAAKDFADLKVIDTSELRNFSWRPYHKKLALDGRVLSMGNRLYLFEPQHAMPLHYYLNLTRTFIMWAVSCPVNVLNRLVNQFHWDNIERMQDLVAINYCKQTTFDSDFWNDINVRANARLNNSPTWQDWLANVRANNKFEQYYTHDSSVMRNYITGYKIPI